MVHVNKILTLYDCTLWQIPISKLLTQSNIYSHTLIKIILLLPFKVVFGKHEDSVDKVSQVVEELRIVLQDKVGPIEGAVLCLRPHVEQVESIDIGGNIGVLGIVSKHTHPSALGKLSIFIIQVFCSYSEIKQNLTKWR